MKQWYPIDILVTGHWPWKETRCHRGSLCPVVGMEHQSMWGRYPRMGLRGKISRKSQLLPCQSTGFLRHFTIIQFLDMKSLTGQSRELIHVGLTFDGRWQNAMQHIGWFAHRNGQCLQVPWPPKKWFDVLWPPTEHQIIIPSVKYKEIWTKPKEKPWLGDGSTVPPSQYKQCWGLGGCHHPYSSTQIWHFWPLISWLIPSGVINHALVENLPFSTMLSHSNLHLVRGFPC